MKGFISQSRFPIMIALVLVILVAFSASQIEPPNTRFSSIIFDVTQPLHSLNSNRTSNMDFAKLVNSGMQLRSENNHPTFFYEIVPETLSIVDVVEEIKRVCQILTETLGTDNILQLIISWTWTTDITDEQNLAEDVNALFKASQFPNIQLNVALNVFNRTCEPLKHANWSTLVEAINMVTADQNIHLGYHHDFVRCGSLFANLIYTTGFTFKITNVNFGESEGVTESLNFFLMGMDYEHEIAKQFSSFVKHEFFYRPTLVESASINNYHRLLIKYADIWASDKDHDKSVIVQLPHTNAREVSQNFKIIPYLNSGFGGYSNIKWLSLVLVVLEAVPQGFNVLVLTHYQWEQLNSPEFEVLHSKAEVTAEHSYPKVILDYSGEGSACDKTYSFSGYNWSLIEHDLQNHMELKNNHPNFTVTLEALLFKFSEDYKPHVDVEFALRMSSKLMVGCVFKKESFATLNSTKVVTACKGINGSLYVLKWTLTLEWREYNRENFLYYQNTLRKELLTINLLRNAILRKHNSSAQVYIQFEIVGVNQVHTATAKSTLPNDVLNYSSFCYPQLEDINSYFGGIITWASIHDFPVILGSKLQFSDTSCYEDETTMWFSFLRRYPSLEKVKTDGKHKNLSSDMLNGSYLYQYKNSPCINFTTEKPEVSIDYFHTKHAGAVFYPGNIQHGRPTHPSEFITMLRFIYHRFRFIEIVIDDVTRDILSATEYLMNTHPSSVANSSVLINYVVHGVDSNSEGFREFLEEIIELSISKKLLGGIHIDIEDAGGELIPYATVVKLEFSKYMTFKSVFDDRVAASGIKIRFGIVLRMEWAFSVIAPLIDKTDPTCLEFVNKIDYIVLKTKLPIAINIDYRYLDQVLNEHLQIKRVFQWLLPNVEIYFRIEFKINLRSYDVAAMKRYLILISYLKNFGTDYKIEQFIVKAFDSKSGFKNGWWEIKNYSDMVDPKMYLERETVYFGRPMTYPPDLAETGPTEVSSPNSYGVVLGFTSAAIFVILLAIVILVLFLRNRKLNIYLSDTDVKEFKRGRPPTQFDTAGGIENLPFNTQHELQMSDLSVDTSSILGKGNFGIVYKGIAKGRAAAVKRPNNECSKATFKSFLNELKVLCYIGEHSNLVTFYGAYTKEIRQGFLYIATELCLNGSLESFLKNKTHVFSQQVTVDHESQQQEKSLHYYHLHRFSKEVANGMEYIESKHVVHGDLSTRNVFLDENLTCKIGDLGLSRKLYEYKKYVKKSHEPLPWKWMAYESLAKMEFTSKSDVWSFGVTLWEIYSLGNTPYGGLSWNPDFVKELRDGLRLGIPQYASENIYTKMKECWNLVSEQRPDFGNQACIIQGLTNSIL